MLAMSIGTRTMSTDDPLIEQTLALALEFNDLTGKPLIPRQDACNLFGPGQAHCRTPLTSSHLFN